MEPLLHTLGELFYLLGLLVVQSFTLATHWLLLIIWVAWWLLGVNWRKAWPVLGNGGWAPLVLLMLIVALVWSRVRPATYDLGVVVVPNFWWQFGAMTLLIGLALICGWLQGLLHWQPAEIDLEPPAHGHADAHGHAAHH